MYCLLCMKVKLARASYFGSIITQINYSTKALKYFMLAGIKKFVYVVKIMWVWFRAFFLWGGYSNFLFFLVATL